MTDTLEPEVQRGRAPSAENEFYFAWGRELLKGSFTLATDALKQMVSVNTFLLGASAVFLDARVARPCCRIMAFGCFLISFAVALFGIIPGEAVVDIAAPQEIKAMQENAMRSKIIQVRLAAFFLFLGLLVAVLGVLLRGTP